jgi:activator of HSP90 ATPase
VTLRDAITATTVVAVDPATAFAVFTDEVDAWWGRGPRFRFRPEGDGVLRFEGGAGGRLIEVFDADGADFYEVGRVRVWEVAKRLVFEFRARAFEPGESTEVEVRFEPVARGTRVTVEHRGWAALGADHPVRHALDDTAFVNVMGVWWGDQLAAAARHAARGRDRAQTRVGSGEWGVRSGM